MKETLKLGISLFLITAISAIVLAISNNITSTKIAEADKLANDTARQEALPQGETFKSIENNKLKEITEKNPEILEIFEGRKEDGSLAGYTFKVSVSGYGGKIEMITGISSEGKITGIKILNHEETPGLGANSTKPEFQNRFKDKPTDKELVVVKTQPTSDNEVQGITSATVTSKAVVKGANTAIDTFNSKFAE